MSTLRARLRVVALVVLLVAGAVLAALLAASGPEEGLPLSPDSTAGDGTRALTEVLDRLGAEVVVDSEPPDDADSVLLLVDNLADEQRDALERQADGGATLVVVDAGSPLAPEPVGSADLGLFATPISRDCDLAALADVERVGPGSDFLFEPGTDAVGCFSRGAGSWLVAEPRGEGALVVTGGPRWVTNDGLDDVDNAVLAVALLAPGGAGDVVAIVPPQVTAPGEGDMDPLALVPGWVWAAAAQLAVAGLLLVWWRSRRLGAPVVEDQPVRLPGSELVLALGGLHAARADAGHAGTAIREGVRRDVARRTGLPADADSESVAQSAVEAGADPDLVDAALRVPLPTNDDALVTLARAVEDLRAELSHAAVGAHGAEPGDARNGRDARDTPTPDVPPDPPDPTRGATRV